MKLSIIVPVYNMAAEQKLEYCLDSLAAQTLADYEVITVDDCSTDDSWTILQQYEARFPDKFRAVHSEENKHQGGAKNIGMRLAKGDWIGFIDSDDWIAPDMYERLIKKAEETGADLVGCDYCLTDEHSMKVGQVVPNNKAAQTGILDDAKRRSLILDGGSLVVKIFRRSMILANELWFPEHIFYEDNALGNSYLLLAKHFEYIAEPLYYYYQHDASTVHTISEKRCEDRCAAGRIMLEEAKRHDFLDKYYAELEYSFTLLFYVNTLFTYMAGVKRTRYRFVKALGEEMRVRFPDFQRNPYYQERTHAEEKKLIRMQMRSTLWFMAYYKLLWAYRNLRKRRTAQ
ncbi:MAG: glycosyltransferase [Bacteroidales bacterium]|nr:glycosyltransferase [Bacteroidales bacterium]MCM1415513.1 glycosyltransferase [bacterium]MCM1423713.1 glycosyltransferase [bacterium]